MAAAVFGKEPSPAEGDAPVFETPEIRRRRKEKQRFREEEDARKLEAEAKALRRRQRRVQHGDRRRVLDDGTEILTINGEGEVFVKCQVPQYQPGSWDVADMIKWMETRSAVVAGANQTLHSLVEMNKRLKQSDESIQQQAVLNAELMEAKEEVKELEAKLADLVEVNKTSQEIGRNRREGSSHSERDLATQITQARVLQVITALKLRTVSAERVYCLPPLAERRRRWRQGRMEEAEAIDAQMPAEDDEEIPPRPDGVRGKCHDIVYHPQFNLAIGLVILLNVIVSVFALTSGQSGAHALVFGVLEDIFTLIFILEAGAKIAGMGWLLYWESNWNRFDFALVILSVIAKIMDVVLAGNVVPIPPTIARAARVVRILSRVAKVFGRATRLFKVWMERYRQTERRKHDQLAIMRAALRMVHQSIGPNVGILFVFYQKIMLTNLLVFGLWLGMAIIPFCLGPPPEFSWSEQSYKGTVGQNDPALETSFFYYGAYIKEHSIGGYNYRMDYAYLLCVLLVFGFQVGGFVFGMAENSNDRILIEEEVPETFRLLLCSHEHSITNKGMLVCTVDGFQRSGKQIAETGSLEEETWLEPTSGFGVLGRVLGVLLYLALFPLSYLSMYWLYQVKNSVDDTIPVLVPFLVTCIRVAVPTYTVPRLVLLESWPETLRAKNVYVRVYLLAMFNVNALMFVLQNAPLPRPDGQHTTCRQIFIGKVYWVQELMDLLFHVVIDAYCTFQRWKSTPRPVFDQDVLAERTTELLYRQALIWASTPYSPMMCLLGFVSTFVMFSFQLFTVSVSFDPPRFGWGSVLVTKKFYQALLFTFVFTYITTLQWLHSPPECGPYSDSDSVYDHFVNIVQNDAPGWVSSGVEWMANPSTTWAILLVTVVLALYKVKMYKCEFQRMVVLSRQEQDEVYDKAQLIRAQNLNV